MRTGRGIVGYPKGEGVPYLRIVPREPDALVEIVAVQECGGVGAVVDPAISRARRNRH